MERYYYYQHKIICYFSFAFGGLCTLCRRFKQRDNIQLLGHLFCPQLLPQLLLIVDSYPELLPQEKNYRKERGKRFRLKFKLYFSLKLQIIKANLKITPCSYVSPIRTPIKDTPSVPFNSSQQKLPFVLSCNGQLTMQLSPHIMHVVLFAETAIKSTSVEILCIFCSKRFKNQFVRLAVTVLDIHS